MKINIRKRSDITNICALCDRDLCSRYFELELQHTEDGRSISSYRHLCTDCCSALSQCFRGDLE